MQLYSRHAGLLNKTNSHYSEFYAGNDVVIPCLTPRQLPLTFELCYPEDSSMIGAADDALTNFHALHPDSLDALSPQLIAQYSELFHNLFSLDFAEYKLAGNPENFRTLIYPTRINVRRYSGNDPDFCIQLFCDCDWDPVDGLELIFHKGNKFVFIGPQHSYHPHE